MGAELSTQPAPWTCGSPLPAEQYASLQQRAVFDCFKWHTQADGQPILCSFPLILGADTWAYLAGMAEALARETHAAERELLRRADLHHILGLPGTLRRCLRLLGKELPSADGVRLMRFDFHWTDCGWRITEVNADVAGGLIESSGVTRLFAARQPCLQPAGDTTAALCDAIAGAVHPGAAIGLMHPSVYSEDRQIMLYLAPHLTERGMSPFLFDPGQLRWFDGRPGIECEWHSGPLDFLLRYFPADWLPRLPRATRWSGLFSRGATAVCNPGWAILTQSKRFPLVWSKLATPVPFWRAMLPETRRPNDVGPRGEGNWVIKPAFGYEGRDVGIEGVSDDQQWRRVWRAARRRPRDWVAQRRFEHLPMNTPAGPAYPCVGVYVINGRATGAYGRLAHRALIDDRSREVVVLVRSQARA